MLNHFCASAEQRWCLLSLCYDLWDETQLGPNSVEECETQSRSPYPEVNDHVGAVCSPGFFFDIFVGSYNLEKLFFVGSDMLVHIVLLVHSTSRACVHSVLYHSMV